MDSSSWPGIVAASFLGLRPWTGEDTFLLILLLLALGLAAMSAAAETALTSVNRIKLRNLEEEGDKKAEQILHLIERPQNFLSTILVMSNVAVIVASTAATILALSLVQDYAEVISTILLSLIVLIFCEITPKTAAVQAPERWARFLVTPVEATVTVLRPVVAALTWITSGIVRFFGGKPMHRGPFLTEEELRMLVDVGESDEVNLEEEKRELIHNVFELGDTIVREVMVPRIDMITIEFDASIEEAMKLIIQGGQSRVPIYKDTIDNIIGLLYAKDLLRIVATHEQVASVEALARPAVFVPETKRLDDLLRELRSQRVHMAIVVDEYGSVAGLVTIEDLVEEIVGDIQDEYDVEEQLFEQIDENDYIVDAKLGLDDLNDLLDSKLTSEDYDTLGGFVYARLDKIPTVGDAVKTEQFTFTVIGTRGRRVTKVKIVRHGSANDEDETYSPDTGERRDDTAVRVSEISPTLPTSSDTAPPMLPPPAASENATAEDTRLTDTNSTLPVAHPSNTSNGDGDHREGGMTPATPSDTAPPRAARSERRPARHRVHGHGSAQMKRG